MTPRNLLFMGSDPIGLPLLEFLHTNSTLFNYRLKAIFTQPDKPTGRGQTVQINAIKQFATQHNIECLQPPTLNQSHTQWLIDNKIDLAFVIAYGQILKKHFLDALPLQAINIHGSLLPHYRGASPIETAIAQGETTTGLCLMYMAPAMDAGPIIGSMPINIDPTDTAPSLRLKMSQLTPQFTHNFLPQILSGNCPSIPQNHSEASYTRKITKEDGWLDFNMTAQQIDCRIRAFQGWPGCFFQHKETIIKVRHSEIAPSITAAPGTVRYLEGKKGLAIETTDGLIIFNQLQRPGGKWLNAKDFLLGFPINEGTLIQSKKNNPLIQSNLAGN